MKKTILILILVLTLCGAAFYVGTQVNERVEYKETIINLRDSEKKQVEQDARLGYITQDSALTLGWNLVDWTLSHQDSTELVKIKWDVRDSVDIRVRDSVVVNYVPFFEAEDTIVTFDELDSLQHIRVQLSLAIKPKYFPTYRKFLTQVQMQELKLTQPEQVESWWAHRWVVYLGAGVTYSYGNLENKAHEGWSFPTIQLGIGIRLY